jgi:hypothetical protein
VALPNRLRGARLRPSWACAQVGDGGLDRRGGRSMAGGGAGRSAPPTQRLSVGGALRARNDELGTSLLRDERSPFRVRSRDARLDRRHGPSVDDVLASGDRCSAVGDEKGDELGDLLRRGGAAEGNPAERLDQLLARSVSIGA